jgi:hypothetical protein
VVHSATFRVVWQEVTQAFETVRARIDAMVLTEVKFMGWKQLLALLPVAGVIALSGCSGHSVGPSPGTEVATNMRSGPNHMTTKIMSVQIAQSFPDAKYVKIFDNQAQHPSGKYWGGTEVVIVGGSGDSLFPDNQIAAAFTPSANHTAAVIEAAIVNPGLGMGTSGFVLSLNQDDNGVPGTALLTAQLPGLPNNGLGLCCAEVVGTIPNGIALSGGKQYWIVLSGQNGQTSDGAAWDQNATDQMHPFLDAAYCAYASKCPSGPGWYPFQGSVFGAGLAFAVLGSN